jgi:hypothetical protein
MTTVADTVWGAAVLGLAVFTIWRIVRVIRRHQRQHRRSANKQFMTGYRAGFRAARAQSSRTTVEATGSSRPRPRLAATDGGGSTRRSA